MDLALRERKITAYLEKLYSEASNKGTDLSGAPCRESLDSLFDTSAFGFREVLLTSIVGIYLDNSFKPSTRFYDCNPRAIYEGPIKNFLLLKGIQHTKSGPLNVAKATPGLNDTWARQRRPFEVADSVVKLIEYIEKGDSVNRAHTIGVSLMQKLIQDSEEVKSLDIEVEPTSDPDFLYGLCKTLIIDTPDSGNTPQKLSALLLSNYHQSLKTGIIVTGGQDRASVTSTTSKKPGDINEESKDGDIYKVYEVTVKKFDEARILDSFDSIVKYNDNHNTNIHEVVVICRKDDCPTEMTKSGLTGYLGRYQYRGVEYYYWDIFEWISSMLQRMTESARKNFYQELNSYINEVNTSRVVKEKWRMLHE